MPAHNASMAMPTPARGTIVAIALLACAVVSCAPRTEAAQDPSPNGRLTGEAAAESQRFQPAATSFVARFKADHPLGRAQSLDASGRRTEAEQLARDTLRDAPELSGLCFERFTLGGAELVMAVCAYTPMGQTGAVQVDWLDRFARMEGVEYAEPNAIVLVEQF